MTTLSHWYVIRRNRLAAWLKAVELMFHPDVPVVPVACALGKARHPVNRRRRIWEVVGGIRSWAWLLFSLFLAAHFLSLRFDLR